MQEKSDPCKLQLLLGHRKAVNSKTCASHACTENANGPLPLLPIYRAQTKQKQAFLWIDPVFLILSCILSLLTPHKLRCLVLPRIGKQNLKV